MKKKIYLHIGQPKTGTSSIQVFLAKNAEKLKQHGYLYPELESLEDARKGEITSGNMGYISRTLLPELHGEFPPGSDYKVELKKLISSIEKVECDNVILSSEFLCVLPATSLFNLANALKDYEVKIVIYLRAQEQFIQSVYAQRVKVHQEARSPLEFIEYLIKHDPHIDYYTLIGRFGDIFGKDSLIIRIYEREQLINHDLVEDFLDAIGVSDRSDFVFDKRGVNKTHNKYVILLQRLVNDHLSPSMAVKLSNFITKIDINSYFDDKHQMINKKLKKKIIEKYRKSNRKLAKEYLGRENGILFLNQPRK